MPNDPKKKPAPAHDPSIYAEPHLRGMHAGFGAEQSTNIPVADLCLKCGYDRRGVRRNERGAMFCPECGASEFDGGVSARTDTLEGDDGVDHTVFDEPSMLAMGAATQTDPADLGGGTRLTYANWLSERMRTFPESHSWWRVLCIAAAAGPWAVAGAFFGGMGPDKGAEFSFSMLGMVLVAPVIEEVMKISAATWAVERRPYWFKSPAQVIIACAAGGAAFATIENLLYLGVYISEPSPEVVAWRWTVCTALHITCSIIAAMGLLRIWRKTTTTLTKPDLSLGISLLILAMIVHGLYNAFAVFLSVKLGDAGF